MIPCEKCGCCPCCMNKGMDIERFKESFPKYYEEMKEHYLFNPTHKPIEIEVH